MTTPTLRCVTDPHLYLGVATDVLTRTRSPTRTPDEADLEVLDVFGLTKPIISTWTYRTQ